MDKNIQILNDARDCVDREKETDSLKNDILRHIRFTLGNDPEKPDKYACFMGLAYSVRDRLIDRWIKTQRSLYEMLSKRVYFLSLEFLPGRFLLRYRHS